MRKYLIGLLVLVGVMIAGACAPSIPQKYVIILQAGTESHEGMARAAHALLYASELKEKGYEVALLFDGAGTEWAKALRDPANKLHGAYQKLNELEITQVICDYCAGAFQVKADLKDGKVPLVSEFKGHPSFVKWVERGYIPIIL